MQKELSKIFTTVYFALLAGWSHSVTTHYWKSLHLMDWRLLSMIMSFFFATSFMIGLLPHQPFLRGLSALSIVPLLIANSREYGINTHDIWFLTFHIIACFFSNKVLFILKRFPLFSNPYFILLIGLCYYTHMVQTGFQAEYWLFFIIAIFATLITSKEIKDSYQ